MEPQGDFAEALCTRGFGKAFFCNSGAEAIEGAIKLARLHTPPHKYKIITFQNGFHGRTYAAVTATAQPKYHEGLGPMVAGFMYAPHGDLDAVRELVDDETCAILIEPVQGEGGVNIAPDGFLAGLRQIADEHDLVLIFDEVQTGMGRLGTWFGYQQWGVQPDVMTLAKGVAGGVACGAIIATDEVAPSLRPGMHASTFGGNPLACAAGVATIQTIEEDGLLDNCQQMSDLFRDTIHRFASRVAHHRGGPRERPDGGPRPDDSVEAGGRRLHGTRPAHQRHARHGRAAAAAAECDGRAGGRGMRGAGGGLDANGGGSRIISPKPTGHAP